jgi:hypothetical protein
MDFYPLGKELFENAPEFFNILPKIEAKSLILLEVKIKPQISRFCGFI